MLNFSLLTRPYYHEIFVCLPDDVEKPLEQFPNTSSRFFSALKFCWFASGTVDVLHSDEPKATRLREAFLRASLVEFVSTEQTLKADLAHLGISKAPITILDLEHPLLHIMRVLRNHEIHLTSHRLLRSEKDVEMVINGTRYQSQATVWTIDALTTKGFGDRKVKTRYSTSEIDSMVKWFNDAQNDWGVNDLLFRAICEWASAIVKTYSLNAAEQIVGPEPPPASFSSN